MLFWRSEHRCYTDNYNTVRLEGWYLVMCMVSLLPSFSLKVRSYPECIGEFSTRYKSTATESRMRSRQWELHHCSIVYTVPIFTQKYHVTHIGHSLSLYVFM